MTVAPYQSAGGTAVSSFSKVRVGEGMFDIWFGVQKRLPSEE